MSIYYGYGKTSVGAQKVARVALSPGAANAISFAWQNPESRPIIVTGVILDVTTAGGTPNAVMDIGVVSSPTSSGDRLIDGANINTVAVYGSPFGANGVNAGKMDEKGGNNDYITGTILTANAMNLAGNVYIFYIVL